jgi:hypothetical protein
MIGFSQRSVGLTIVIACTLAGCDLYTGTKSNNDTWSYCAADGFYQCHGDNCTWVSPTCPSGQGGTGYACTDNTQCAAGCFCSNGSCTEGGFCSKDSDCGVGFHCDTQRSSCEPNTATCGGDFATTCTNGPATCPVGEVPLLENGCWDGNCTPYAQCNVSPVCSHINDETDCLSRTECASVYNGINCTKSDGSPCHTGDTGCTCQSYEFASCASKTSARVIIQSSGDQIEADNAPAVR